MAEAESVLMNVIAENSSVKHVVRIAPPQLLMPFSSCRPKLMDGIISPFFRTVSSAASGEHVDRRDRRMVSSRFGSIACWKLLEV